MLATCPALAQELEPRAYRALPTELNFVVVAYSFSSGNVVVDPSVPIEDLEADIHTAVLAYLRTFGLFGRSASIAVSAPYVALGAPEATTSRAACGWDWTIPLQERHSLKLAAHTGAITRVGADFDSATIAYTYRWGGVP